MLVVRTGAHATIGRIALAGCTIAACRVPAAESVPAVAPTTKSSNAGPPCRPARDDETTLSWVASGLLVNGRTIVDPTTGTIEARLPKYTMPGALGPDARRTVETVSQQASDVVVVRRTDGLELRRIEVPPFVTADGIDAERLALIRRTNAHWWSANELLVVQDLYPHASEADCRVLSLDDEAWIEPTSCPQGGMSSLASVRRGPAELVELVSSGEGHPAVDVVAWSPTTGPQRDVGVPAFDLYPFGPLYVRFTEDPQTLLLETPCDLREQRPCFTKVNERDDQSVFLFRWRHGEGLQLLQRDLPPGATYAPLHDRWAWPTADGIAIGDPEGDHRCIARSWP